MLWELSSDWETKTNVLWIHFLTVITFFFKIAESTLTERIVQWLTEGTIRGNWNAREVQECDHKHSQIIQSCVLAVRKPRKIHRFLTRSWLMSQSIDENLMLLSLDLSLGLILLLCSVPLFTLVIYVLRKVQFCSKIHGHFYIHFPRTVGDISVFTQEFTYFN